MRNSTVLVILLLIVFLVMVSYVQDLKANVQKVSEHIDKQTNVIKPIADEDLVQPGALHQGNSIIMPGNTANIVTTGANDTLLDLAAGSAMIPLQPSKLVSISHDENGERIPLPVSGRFFGSEEFHMVGHLTRVRNNAHTTQVHGLPVTTLPLYGQRIQATKLSWVYAVIGNDGRKYTVHVEMPSGDYTDCAKGPHGCRQLVNGDLVAVPGIDNMSLWRVRMFSKL